MDPSNGNAIVKQGGAQDTPALLDVLLCHLQSRVCWARSALQVSNEDNFEMSTLWWLKEGYSYSDCGTRCSRFSSLANRDVTKKRRCDSQKCKVLWYYISQFFSSDQDGRSKRDGNLFHKICLPASCISSASTRQVWHKPTTSTSDHFLRATVGSGRGFQIFCIILRQAISHEDSSQSSLINSPFSQS